MNCVALSTCKYSSIADWFESIFQSFIFININGVCESAREPASIRSNGTMLATRCESIYFQFSVLSLVKKMKRINGEKIAHSFFFVISFCCWCMNLCLSCKFPSKYMELIVLKLVYTLMYATLRINMNASPVYTDDW